MATQAEVLAHRETVGDLADLAAFEVREFLRSLGTEDPRRIAKAVREFLPAVAAAYTLASTTMAADWYEDLRTEAAVAAAFSAVILDAPDTDVLQDAIGYALVPLFSDVTAPADAAGNLERLAKEVVTGGDRQTIQANATRDKAAPRYARHASANACAFCRMLATRGAEYRSEETALRVVLDRPRNKRGIGEKYHNDCHCTAVPVWGSRSSYEEAPYVAGWREAYYDATKELGGAKDTKAILAHMRESMNLQH